MRFKSGQVVCVKAERKYVRLIQKSGEPFCKDGNIYAQGGNDTWYHKDELRALTQREQGRT